jgi:FeS assembly protein IscX
LVLKIVKKAKRGYQFRPVDGIEDHPRSNPGQRSGRVGLHAAHHRFIPDDHGDDSGAAAFGRGGLRIVDCFVEIARNDRIVRGSELRQHGGQDSTNILHGLGVFDSWFGGIVNRLPIQSVKLGIGMTVAYRTPDHFEGLEVVGLLAGSELRKRLAAKTGGKKEDGNRPDGEHAFTGRIARETATMILMAGFNWDDSEDIALALMEAHPDVDPLTVRFTDLHKWITALPEFAGDPAKSNEGKLEAIQMAWHEEYTDQ